VDGADEGEVRFLRAVALAGEDQVEVLPGGDRGDVGRAGAHLFLAIDPPRHLLLHRIVAGAEGVLLAAVERQLRDVVGILDVLPFGIDTLRAVHRPDEPRAEAAFVDI